MEAKLLPENYWVAREGAVRGPFSHFQLIEGIESLEVRESDQICAATLENWYPLQNWIRAAQSALRSSPKTPRRNVRDLPATQEQLTHLSLCGFHPSCAVSIGEAYKLLQTVGRKIDRTVKAKLCDLSWRVSRWEWASYQLWCPFLRGAANHPIRQNLKVAEKDLVTTAVVAHLDFHDSGWHKTLLDRSPSGFPPFDLFDGESVAFAQLFPTVGLLFPDLIKKSWQEA